MSLTEAQLPVDYSAMPPNDLALLCFEQSDEAAWTEFIRRFHPLIARVALRVARQWGEHSPQVVDDLVQDTYLKLCAERVSLLQKFSPVHSDAIYGYIKVFTANLVHDRLKASHSGKRGGSEVTASIDAADFGPARGGLRSAEAIIERSVLIQQIDVCVRGICSGPSSERDRRIFWLYYRAGLAASAIATLPTIGLSTKGVESTILRLTRQVRERLDGRAPVSASNRSEGVQPKESL
jgi:RNA polymerase sigma-70 factor, ECF subfamily